MTKEERLDALCSSCKEPHCQGDARNCAEFMKLAGKDEHEERKMAYMQTKIRNAFLMSKSQLSQCLPEELYKKIVGMEGRIRFTLPDGVSYSICRFEDYYLFISAY